MNTCKQLAVVLVVAMFSAVVSLVGSPTALAFRESDTEVGSSSGSVSSGGDGSVDVAVMVQFTSAAADGSGGGGTAVSSQSVTASVHPVCWYIPYKTGEETASSLESNDTVYNVTRFSGHTLEEYRYRFPDYESHASDSEGYWYIPWCSPEYYRGDDLADFSTLSKSWVERNMAVWVPAGGSPPEPEIDGETLARAAWDAVTIPTATIGYNPMVGDVGATIVGMDTWVWATGDTPKEVQVTATAGSTTATITATAKWLTLQPKDGTAKCTGFGIPWTEENDAKGTDCKIVFNRSSAHFKDSVTPVDIKVSYAIEFTATDGAAGTMDTHTTSTTTSIPVAEIQTLNTQPTKQP